MLSGSTRCSFGSVSALHSPRYAAEIYSPETVGERSTGEKVERSISIVKSETFAIVTAVADLETPRIVVVAISSVRSLSNYLRAVGLAVSDVNLETRNSHDSNVTVRFTSSKCKNNHFPSILTRTPISLANNS